MSILIEKSGLLATIQDRGRTGYGRYGISTSGAMDKLAHQLANWLVGNIEDAATIEITLSGFQAVVQQDIWIAVTGGDLQATVDGQELPMWRPVYVRKESNLSFTKTLSGCRAYIAVAGGWDIEPVLSSYSTYVRAGIGGFQGRSLQAGDTLDVRSMQPDNLLNRRIDSVFRSDGNEVGKHTIRWRISTSVIPYYSKQPVIRIVMGQQWMDFDENTRQNLLDDVYTVTPQSDRMGYRLAGTPLQVADPKQYVSEAVAYGTIQVPPDGQPIVLMADRQTLGGYAKIAQVISLDLPLMAQLAPGDRIHFRLVSLEEAQRLYLEWIRELQILQRMIQIRLQEI